MSITPLTAVIVEDEQIFLKELVLSINWDKLGINLIGTADDGIKGEALIKETEPDIVITDIRLPGKNGLEMLSSCPVNNAVILSGHTDFEYTKRAIRLGVFDYLKKPIDDDELEETLARLAERVREENKELEIHKNADGMEIELPTTVQNHTVQMAINNMKENCTKQIGLADVAEAVRLSESHLSTLFKEVTGMNFLQYMNALRMNRAVYLLKHSNMNISEIAANSGFPTPGYFTKLFKRYFNTTPTQFRDGG